MKHRKVKVHKNVIIRFNKGNGNFTADDIAGEFKTLGEVQSAIDENQKVEFDVPALYKESNNHYSDPEPLVKRKIVGPGRGDSYFRAELKSGGEIYDTQCHADETFPATKDVEAKWKEYTRPRALQKKHEREADKVYNSIPRLKLPNKGDPRRGK